MGTVARKAPKKAKKNGNGVAHSKLVALQESVSRTQSGVDNRVNEFMELVEAVTDKTTVHQTIMDAALQLQAIKDAVTAAIKKFDEMALEHRNSDGGFALGRVSIAFPETTRVSPKWKDEAIRQAGLLAKAKGQKFNPNAYEAKVKEVTPESTSTRVKLTRSEG